MAAKHSPQFSTSDRYLVAYLLHHGLKWLRATSDGHKVSFQYAFTPHCNALHQQYRTDPFVSSFRTHLDDVWKTIRTIQTREEEDE